MEGKIIVVTGATSGIGKQTALQLAEKGARVILVSRSQKKCRRTKQEIIDKTGNKNIHYQTADLSTLGGIRQAAEGIQEKVDRIDVLVNNAGALFWNRQESADGIEMTFALNHLNYFLLTNLLLGKIKNSPAGRIINISSGAHIGQKLDFDDLQNQKSYRPFTAYGRSKLANLYFTYELDRRLKGTGVTVNAVHPGFVATNFGKEGNPLARMLMPIISLFAKSSHKGAETPVYLASSAEAEGVSGKYFFQKEAISSSPVSYDPQIAERLWQVSEELTGLS